MTPQELATRVAPWRRAQTKADSLVSDRDAAIREALPHMTHAQIAWATGLTRGRINQIAQAPIKES